jgi:predicted nucleic acid-binding protein
MAYRRIFIDSDIFIDVLLKREQFYKAGQKLLNIRRNEDGTEICTSALIIANILYISIKALGKNEAKESIQKLLNLVTVFPLNADCINLAMNSNFTDIEDAMQHFIAMQNQCDLIITRNLKHFKNSLLPIMSANEYLRTI